MNKKELSIGNYVKYKGKSGYRVIEACEDVVFIRHETLIPKQFSLRYEDIELEPETFFALFLSNPNWNLIVSDFGMKPYQYANMPGICLFFDEEDNICYLTMFPNFKIKHVHTLQNLLQIAYPQVKLRGEEDAA